MIIRESTPPPEEPVRELSPEPQDAENDTSAASPSLNVPEVEVKIEPEELPETEMYAKTFIFIPLSINIKFMIDFRKSLHCCRCKATQSWLWKKTASGAFLCTTCEAREQDAYEIAPIPRRTHKDSVVLLENEHADSLESKTSSEVPGKGDAISEIDAAGSAEALAASLLPTRKSSRSTRSTISNSNPYAYPRPVMSKPKEKKSIAKFTVSILKFYNRPVSQLWLISAELRASNPKALPYSWSEIQGLS